MNKKGGNPWTKLPPSLELELPSSVIAVIVASMVAFVVVTVSVIPVVIPVSLLFVTKASVLVVAIIKMPFVKSSEL